MLRSIDRPTPPRRIRTTVQLLAASVVAVAAVVLPALPASASVGASASISLPTTAVGQTGGGSLTIVNQNLFEHENETNRVTQIQMAASCGAAPQGANLCSSPEVGAITVSSPAIGVQGTVCAGMVFTVSTPDAAGIVTFTPEPPSIPVILGPAGSSPNDRCSLLFSFSTARMPSGDASANPGVQTRANVGASVESQTTHMVAFASSTVLVAVNPAVPGISGVASKGSTATSVSDVATLTGAPGAPAPTGSVTFRAYGPGNATCAGVAAATVNVPIVAGTASSGPMSVGVPGVYRLRADYGGDINYFPVSTACNAPGQTVTLVRHAKAGDFDGDGDSDVGVFRPSSGEWFVAGGLNVSFGALGDLPVAADYDGDGDVDVAVFRPSSGEWFVAGQFVVSFGTIGDVPVPADYDGDGDADVAVFRPLTGQWFVKDGTPYVTSFGTSGDVPVPGDFDGDGDADKAVFRPLTGQWFVAGGATTFFGTSTDVAVPGDYDGNGTTDVAVFRPSTGQWFVAGQFTVSFGTTGDVPVPGDFDGDGDTDIAVFRPSTGQWFLTAGPSAQVSLGTTGDIPVGRRA